MKSDIRPLFRDTLRRPTKKNRGLTVDPIFHEFQNESLFLFNPDKIWTLT